MNNPTLKILGQRGRITIPYEIRVEMGFECNDILSFTPGDDGKTVLVRREKLCNSCKAPMPTPQPEGSPLLVPQDRGHLLMGLLDELTPTELRTVLIHLSVRWAQMQQGEGGPASAP